MLMLISYKKLPFFCLIIPDKTIKQWHIFTNAVKYISVQKCKIFHFEEYYSNKDNAL